ncbi:MAG: hypothetical protein DMF04_06455 [Verrucomicrobia bacterium]|nr:MAG: hypothetical protein DMF04_06455 [Verrucomicrobiota bacterium]
MPATDSKQNRHDEQSKLWKPIRRLKATSRVEWRFQPAMRLLSLFTRFAPSKFGWKWNMDSDIFPPREFFARLHDMQLDLPETTSKIGGPLVRQFSVFLPNKVGAMLQIVKLLNAHATHVVALSITESTDAAIARIIVSDPERVEELFRDNNIAYGVSELMVVELREVATQFIKILSTLLMAEVNLHFSYPLLTRPNGRAALAMHVDDSECASSVLIGEGFRLLSQTDISR